MGVALGAEVFMTAIEVVTAKETKKETVDADGKKQVFHARVWNATVANLTLMALGSSAPEILLNVIEVTLIEKFVRTSPPLSTSHRRDVPLHPPLL